jgi:hypothetical protein
MLGYSINGHPIRSGIGGAFLIFLKNKTTKPVPDGTQKLGCDLMPMGISLRFGRSRTWEHLIALPPSESNGRERALWNGNQTFDAQDNVIDGLA